MLTVQGISNIKFYFSSGDQHIHNNFFADTVDDAGEPSICSASNALSVLAAGT
jgi:hypothetical protein